MLKEKINKFYFIKKSINFKETKLNKDRKKTQASLCYFKQKDKSYRKKSKKECQRIKCEGKKELKKNKSE